MYQGGYTGIYNNYALTMGVHKIYNKNIKYILQLNLIKSVF